MRFSEDLRRDWPTSIPTELLSGVLVALALIPEAIGFSMVAGADPKFGLYASSSIAVVTAIVAGRPAMIDEATATMVERLAKDDEPGAVLSSGH